MAWLARKKYPVAQNKFLIFAGASDIISLEKIIIKE